MHALVYNGYVDGAVGLKVNLCFSTIFMTG